MMGDRMFIAPSYSFTRPGNTTQYGAGDLIANDVDAADVVPLKFSTEKINDRGKIVAVRLFTSTTTVTAAIFALHLFRTAPTPGVGDNGAFSVASVRDLLATVACNMSSGSTVSSADKMQRFALSTPIVFEAPFGQRMIYGLLATGTSGTYSPASGELFEATLEIEG
jgi:hypothetical protein